MTDGDWCWPSLKTFWRWSALRSRMWGCLSSWYRPVFVYLTSLEWINFFWYVQSVLWLQFGFENSTSSQSYLKIWPVPTGHGCWSSGYRLNLSFLSQHFFVDPLSSNGTSLPSSAWSWWPSASWSSSSRLREMLVAEWLPLRENIGPVERWGMQLRSYFFSFWDMIFVQNKIETKWDMQFSLSEAKAKYKTNGMFFAPHRWLLRTP